MSDFENTYNRLVNGSSKWLKMVQENPNVPEGVIPLSVADMDFQNSDVIKRSLNSYIANNILGYSRPTEDYLKSIKDFYKNFHNANIETDWIVTTPGVVSALATSIRAYTNVNDGVIIFTPVYNPFYNVVAGQNRRLEEIPLIYKDNKYNIDFDKLEEVAKVDDVKLILLCSPHNPGGTVWSRSTLEKIGKIAKENNLYIVSDEIHSDFIHDGFHNVITEIEGLRDIVVCCTSASKTFNIAGLQCSNIFIPNKILRDKFIFANDVVGIERANVLGLVATMASYTKGLPWLLEAKKVINYNLKMVEEFFCELDNGFKVMPANAGFLAWINFRDLKMNKNDFYKLLNEANFYINKGEEFGEEGEYFFRLNVGLPTKDLSSALERLKKVFEKNKKNSIH